MARSGRLDAVLTDAAATHGGRAAIREGDRSWSFAELDAACTGLASQLDRWGVRPGDRVAVRSGNRAELPVAVLALCRLGAAAVLLSPAWREREVDHALDLTGARRALVDAGDGGILADRLGADAVVDLDAAAISRPVDAAGDEPPRPEGDGSGEAVLVFSSGTTGMPKAVRHTHASLLAATDHWVAALGLGPDDRFQVSTPPSHILGLLNLLAALRAGAAVRLHRRFDLDQELRSIEEDRMTLKMAVAPIALAMANHPRLESFDLSSLRYVMWGATPVTASVAATVTARTGVPFLAAYGASEVPVLAVNPVDDPASWRLDSPGLPPADVELRVVDLVTGEPLPAGATGELEARGPSTMAGYLPEAADEEAFHDGWYRTGDVGVVEEGGWVRLTDRSKDMIKVSGFQVAPAEIESVLLGHAAVLDCAVFGVADDRRGEAPVAAVVLDPAIGVADGELADLVDRSLAGYKRLGAVVAVPEVPRLPSGKALRRELRDRWLTGELGPGARS
ncbi:class I adenylate-forming enzyme family protein [Dermatobacter hominis]|uniref:class I adenylate-forming enzyme family protein n=1 Tax=Dermatobacter hominis TaxID=2884263 RepID=UPI001D127428|nr:AMP-binding protein [Dermatobacter hominis]UDY38029.1 AMP-binding protein [Dermatobacter hominis]